MASSAQQNFTTKTETKIKPSEQLAKLYLSKWDGDRKVYETMCREKMKTIFDLLLDSPLVKPETKTAILQTSIYGKK